MEQSSTTAFVDWLRQVFDNPVADPAWRWGVAADIPEPAPPDCVAYLTWLFEEPESALAPYSDAQINQGLWYLVNASWTCGSASNPAALRPFSTIRNPPYGKIARLNGWSVCNPTITSFSRSI